jgi:uncharacterized protein
MRTVRLGKTGLMVSEVGFGGIPIQRLNDAEAQAVITRALDLGVTFLDTAHGYSTSEERIGRAIAGRRAGLILATKSPACDGKTFSEHMAQSFQRLGVEYIDLFQFHNVSTPQQYAQLLAPDGALAVARAAQATGRIGHIGVTSHSMEMALEMVPSGHFETLMFPFNFVTREPLDRLIPLCRQHDVGFIVMKPMAGGMLDDARLAFKYLRQLPDLVSIPGIEKVAEIEEIVGLVQGSAELSSAEQAEMARVAAELGTRFCRRCDYCQPCPQNIRISTVMNLRSFWKRFPPQRLYDMMEGAITAAEQCADCGKCEERCPYHLEIRQTLRENVKLYREQIAPRR